MDFGSWGSGGGLYNLIGNGADPVPGAATGAFPLCSSANTELTMIGNKFPGWSSGNNFILPQGHIFSKDYGIFNGGYMRMGHSATSGNENIGYGFLTQFGVEIGGYGFNAQSADDGNGGLLWGPMVGHDRLF